jgi:hypothetical protein
MCGRAKIARRLLSGDMSPGRSMTMADMQHWRQSIKFQPGSGTSDERIAHALEHIAARLTDITDFLEQMKSAAASQAARR